MSDILSKIAATTRLHVEKCKRDNPLSAIEEAAKNASPVRKFQYNLQKAKETSKFGLITEIKKASPSRGLIRDDFDPPVLAKAYEDGGSSCLSVLTDVPYFMGADVLVEVHDANELERAHKLKTSLLGINNRNLKTFDVTLDTTIELSKYADKNKMLVSESGLFTYDDLRMVNETCGINSFLIGEALMRQNDVTKATQKMLLND